MCADGSLSTKSCSKHPVWKPLNCGLWRCVITLLSRWEWREAELWLHKTLGEFPPALRVNELPACSRAVGSERRLAGQPDCVQKTLQISAERVSPACSSAEFSKWSLLHHEMCFYSTKSHSEVLFHKGGRSVFRQRPKCYSQHLVSIFMC